MQRKIEIELIPTGDSQWEAVSPETGEQFGTILEVEGGRSPEFVGTSLDDSAFQGNLPTVIRHLTNGKGFAPPVITSNREILFD
jgi:hypothetical protein